MRSRSSGLGMKLDGSIDSTGSGIYMGAFRLVYVGGLRYPTVPYGRLLVSLCRPGQGALIVTSRDQLHAHRKVPRSGVPDRDSNGRVARKVEGQRPFGFVQCFLAELRVLLRCRKRHGRADEQVEIAQEAVHDPGEPPSLTQCPEGVYGGHVETGGHVRARPVSIVVGPFRVPALVMVRSFWEDDLQRRPGERFHVVYLDSCDLRAQVA